ncbi:hypothetical protein [Nodularia chucula]|uniref:hypothetical protein n=1 Tax=Nodularia chucula TaxID=3093667 RepID=UPI0039C5BEE5
MTALLPEYQKKIRTIYLNDIQGALEIIKGSNHQEIINHAYSLIESLKTDHHLNSSPLSIPDSYGKEMIKSEMQLKWFSFFSSTEVIIDHHEFYIDIKNRLQNYFDEIIRAIDIVAQRLKLISEIETAYIQAKNVGKSQETLIENLYSVTEKSQPIFVEYYSVISTFRNSFCNYLVETIAQINDAKINLVNEVKNLIFAEQSSQCEYGQVFLRYRLLIAQHIDPICNVLKKFYLEGQQLRSDFIKLLISKQEQPMNDLEILAQDLYQHFDDLFWQLEQMQSVEIAEKAARQNIEELGQSRDSSIFKETFEETHQLAIRGIADTVKQEISCVQMLQYIQNIEQEYQAKIHELSVVEKKYLELRKKVVKSISSDSKFSVNQFKFSSDCIPKLFKPNSSYQLSSSILNNHAPDFIHELFREPASDETLFTISELGDNIGEIMITETKLSYDELSAIMVHQVSELGMGNMVNFIPISLDDSTQLDVNSFLFFSYNPEQVRPELTCVLKIFQEKNILHIQKLINILPLTNYVLNDLLASYKSAFHVGYREVTQLIEDQFLANKLKLDFQGHIAQSMTRTKQQLKSAYLEDLKQYTLQVLASDFLTNNQFLESVESLILATMNAMFKLG